MDKKIWIWIILVAVVAMIGLRKQAVSPLDWDGVLGWCENHPDGSAWENPDETSDYRYCVDWPGEDPCSDFGYSDFIDDCDDIINGGGGGGDCTDDSDCNPPDTYCHIPLNQCMSGCEILEMNDIYTDCQHSSVGFCFDDPTEGLGVYQCNEGYAYQVYIPSLNEYGWFCYFSNSWNPAGFQECPSGWDCDEGLCQQNECTPDAMWCEGDEVWECSSDGQSKYVVETCESGYECVRPFWDKAYCQCESPWYCPDIAQGCYWVCSNNKPNTYCEDTSEKCNDNFVWCSDGESCDKRIGECPAGTDEYDNSEDCMDSLNGGGGGTTTTTLDNGDGSDGFEFDMQILYWVLGFIGIVALLKILNKK